MSRKVLIYCVFLILVGCSHKHQIEKPDQSEIVRIATKALEARGESGEFVVAENDLVNLARFRVLEADSKGEKITLVEIIPLKWEDEPCLYVLQFDEGFEIVSADKRSPSLLRSATEVIFASVKTRRGLAVI